MTTGNDTYKGLCNAVGCDRCGNMMRMTANIWHNDKEDLCIQCGLDEGLK